MTGRPLSSTDLVAFMQAHAILGEVLHLETPTRTVEAAAQAVGTDPDEIVKSILFLVGEQAVLAITCGPAYVDQRALASLFSVGCKKVKLASPDFVLRETGYEVGAMPPFGHLRPLLTLVDRRVLEKAQVYAGGGSDYALVRLSPQAILEASAARVLDLLAPTGEDSDPGGG